MVKRYEVGLNEEEDILIKLGAPTQHMILTPEQAIELAGQLLRHAKKSKKFRGGSDTPLNS